MYPIAALEGQLLDLDEIQYLTPDYLEEVRKFINVTMTKAALVDFSFINKSDNIDFDPLDAVDKYYDRAKIDELIKESDYV
jgi:hypothetical protein